jgi:hypothetical protein
MSPISCTAVLTLILIGCPLWHAEAQSELAESPAKIEKTKKEQLKKPADPHNRVAPKQKPSQLDLGNHAGNLEQQQKKNGLENRSASGSKTNGDHTSAEKKSQPRNESAGKTKERDDRPGPCEEDRANPTRYQKCLQEPQHKSAPKQELKPTPNPTH